MLPSAEAHEPQRQQRLQAARRSVQNSKTSKMAGRSRISIARQQKASAADGALEAGLLEWVSTVVGGEPVSPPMDRSLRSGVVLCQLVNALRPKTVKRISKSKDRAHHSNICS